MLYGLDNTFITKKKIVLTDFVKNTKNIIKSNYDNKFKIV